MGKALINDHILMVNRKGLKKAVPCWQIEMWIRGEVFSLDVPKGNVVGWDFSDCASAKRDYAIWLADEARKKEEKRRKLGGGPVPADGGVADAMRKARNRAPEDEWGSPPMSEAGTEAASAAEKPKPRDII